MTIATKISTTIFKSIATVMLIAFSLTSCKKDTDKPVNVSIEGVYAGKYGFDNEVPSNDQKFNLKANGIYQEIGLNSGTVLGEGTWTLNGNDFTAAYTMNFAPFNKYSIKATFAPVTGKLTGTWGGELDPTDGGKIEMTRQ